MMQQLAALSERYPGRDAQISRLASILAPSTSTSSQATPLFVSGPPSVGKTAVVLDLLEAMGLRYAYVNCTEAARTKPLLRSLLHQIKGGKRRREDGYAAAAARCDSLSDFLHALPGATARRPGPCLLVLDNAQRLAGSDLLTALMRLREASGANVGLLLVSNAPWDSGIFSSGAHNVVPPVHVPFPAYCSEQLVKILELGLPAADADLAPLYRQFLRLVIPALCRATNNLLDLRSAAAALWPRYIAPLRAERPATAAQQQRAPGALAARIKTDLQRMLSELDVSASAASAAPEGGGEGGGAGGAGPLRGEAGGGADRRASSSGLAFELPYVSKFLLLAAYVASRNKPASDRAVFDPTCSRRGRRDAQATDRQAEAAVEAGLRSPHSFPLERLLHIFYCLYAEGNHDEDDGRAGRGEVGRDRAAAQAAREVQVAEVQMQVSTLVALRLLLASGGDMLEGGTYRCNVGDDMAAALAENVGLSLRDFLKLA